VKNPKLTKTVSWLAISGSGLSTIGIIWSLLSDQLGFNLSSFFVLWVTFLGVYGGVLLLKGDIGGGKLLTLFFLVQAPSYHSEAFFYSVQTSIAFIIKWGEVPGVVYGINFYALIMLAICIYLVRSEGALTSQGSGTPENGAAS